MKERFVCVWVCTTMGEEGIDCKHTRMSVKCYAEQLINVTMLLRISSPLDVKENDSKSAVRK